jgi:hypothetical protein
VLDRGEADLICLEAVHRSAYEPTTPRLIAITASVRHLAKAKHGA